MSYNPNNPNGQATMANSAPVVLASNQTGVPVTFTGSTDVATQTTLSAINAKMVSGTDIGDVTINNSTGAAAVNIQDGGNSITVDGTVSVNTHGVTVASGGIASGAIASGALAAGSIASGAAVSGALADGSVVTLGAKTDAKSTATDGTSITAMQVLKQISASVQAPLGMGSTGSGVPATAEYAAGQAKSADIAAATTGNLTGATFDLLGKQVMTPYAMAQQILQGKSGAMTATTSTVLLAAVASNYLYITSILVTNSHATVGTLVSLQDGNGGTSFYEGYAAPAGGGFSVSFPTPLRCPTAGNAIYCVNGTTGSNTYVSVTGYKATI